jgi:hypothetical protein
MTSKGTNWVNIKFTLKTKILQEWIRVVMVGSINE